MIESIQLAFAKIESTMLAGGGLGCALEFGWAGGERNQSRVGSDAMVGLAEDKA